MRNLLTTIALITVFACNQPSGNPSFTNTNADTVLFHSFADYNVVLVVEVKI